MFSGCAVQLDSKETKLGYTDREASPSAVKNRGTFLMLCPAFGCVPIVTSGCADIPEGSACHLLQQVSSQFG